MTERPQAGTVDSRKRRRRRVGLALILAAIVFVLLGQLVFDPFLKENLYVFVLYWGSCALFTVLALYVALMDMVAVRREAERAERKLVQETFGRKDGKPRDDKREP